MHLMRPRTQLVIQTKITRCERRHNFKLVINPIKKNRQNISRDIPMKWIDGSARYLCHISNHIAHPKLYGLKL